MEKPFFTIFTPVYNGAKHIHRVFESIKGQSFKNFEWIVVNDGSVDNTAELIKNFIEEQPVLNIIYLEQSNLGKHIAWNKGVELAKGQLFVPADADDFFMSDTLSFFFETWNALTLQEQSKLSGINVLCLDNDTENIVGDAYPRNGIKTTNLELAYKYKIVGEKWGCIRSDLLKARPFPIIKGYVTENYVWLQLSKSYKVICFNKALRRYYTTDNGITQTVKVNNYSAVKTKVKLKYNLWFINNFGLYVLLKSPKDFVRVVGSTVWRILLFSFFYIRDIKNLN